MMARIIQTPTFLTLLGGGPTHFGHLEQALSLAPILVAADGGADTALEAGYTPDAVIGDFDSLSTDTRQRIPDDRLHHVAEQDSTDFEKCLQRVDARAVLALGFTGARLDHTLAACSVLTRFPDLPVILFGEEDLCILAPSSLRLDLGSGTTFSIFPFGPVTGRSTGLRYPIDGLELAPLGQIGTSNEATGPVELHLHPRTALITVPHTALEQVLSALTGGAVS